MTMTLTKAQKLVVFAGAVLALGANAGVFFYIPKRVDKLESKVEKDHDTLVKIEVKLDILEKKLERNGVVKYEINTNQFRKHSYISY